jgi:hypothetical protein
VRHILNSPKHLMTSGFQRLHSVMTRWTNPLSTSLMLGTVTDLFRSKSQLVAENALLRQQLIILRRQVKRPACTRADRMVLVLLARAVQTWKQVLFIIQPETLLRWHRKGVPLVLEAQVKGDFSHTETGSRDHYLHQRDGQEQPALGSRTHPWGVAQVGY